MNISKAFSFQFEDQQWLSKLGLGSIIAIVPILNLAWTGYMVEILRNVSNGHPEPLPTWDDIGKKFTTGLILFGAGLVYALPILIVACLPLSVILFSSLFSGNSNLEDVGQAIAGAGGVLFYCLLCVFIIYSIVLSVIYPAILVVFAKHGTFASCFNFRESFDLISKNTGSFFGAWGLSLIAAFGIGLVAGTINAILSIIPCLGQVAALVVNMAVMVYVSTIYVHLFGQFGAALNDNRPMGI